MKRILFAAALLLPLATMAQHRERYLPPPPTPASNVIQDTTEFARVLDYKTIPGPGLARQVCSPAATQPSDHSTAGAVIGGLTGALVGSRFGGGNGRNATTIAGAVGGAMVGDRIGSGNGATQQQCETVYEPGPPAGYQVTYDYKGKLLTTTTSSPPGEYLRVRNRITVE